MRPGELKRGRKVWRVRYVDDLTGPLAEPELRYGVVLRCGPQYVWTEWDSGAVQKEARGSAEWRLHSSPADAWAAARAEINKLLMQALQDTDRLVLAYGHASTQYLEEAVRK